MFISTFLLFTCCRPQLHETTLLSASRKVKAQTFDSESYISYIYFPTFIQKWYVYLQRWNMSFRRIWFFNSSRNFDYSNISLTSTDIENYVHTQPRHTNSDKWYTTQLKQKEGPSVNMDPLLKCTCIISSSSYSNSRSYK